MPKSFMHEKTNMRDDDMKSGAAELIDQEVLFAGGGSSRGRGEGASGDDGGQYRILDRK